MVMGLFWMLLILNKYLKEVGTLKESDLMPSILVNNAGISLDNLLMRIKKDEWEKVIATNLSSAFLSQ